MDNQSKQLIADTLRFGAGRIEADGQELTDGEVIDALAAAFGGYAEKSAPGYKRDAELFRRIAEAVEPAQAASGGIESELRAIRLLLAEQNANRAEQHAALSRILKHGFEDMRDDASQLRETLKFLR